MSAAVGLLLISVAVALFALALLVVRRPSPPRWVTVSLASELITITCLGLLVMGLGLIGQFLVSFGREPIGWGGGLLIAAALVILAIGISVFARARGQRRRDDVAETVTQSASPRPTEFSARLSALVRPGSTSDSAAVEKIAATDSGPSEPNKPGGRPLTKERAA